MSFELSLMLKSFVVLFGTAAFAGLFRKSSASTQYSIWAGGLIAVLVLPIMSILLPEVSLPLLPAPVSQIARPAAPVSVDTIPATKALPEAAGSKSTVSKPGLLTSLPKQWPFAVWGIGVVLVVVRSLLGIRDVRQLKRRSSPVVDPDWQELLSRLKRDLGISSAVDLRIGGGSIPPMTWGILRHTILFPNAATEWPSVRTHHVMAHELTHVKRRDGLMQLFAQAACAIYWFNPLVWYAAYRLRIERERACDDQVLQLGASPQDYAEHLLQIARDVNGEVSVAAISMTPVSGFEQRLRLVLDSTRSRRTLSRRSTLLSMCFAALLTAITATGHLAAQTPRWVGTWKLNKGRTTVQPDPRLREMFDSITEASVKLEPAQGGIKWLSSIVAGRLSQRQTIEATLPLGVPIDLNDLPLFLRNPYATALPGGTALLTPSSDSLQIELNFQPGGRTSIRYTVSPDGSTLTVVSPEINGSVVFNRQ